MTTFRLRVRQQGRLARLRGIEVESIEPAATVSQVPGSEIGMALVRGQIIPVLRLGDFDGNLIVGRVAGEVLGVVGLRVVDFELVDPSLEESSPTASLHAIDEWRTLPHEPDSLDDTVFELDIEGFITQAKLRQRPLGPAGEDIA